jgi:hypothetical protein
MFLLLVVVIASIKAGYVCLSPLLIILQTFHNLILQIHVHPDYFKNNGRIAELCILCQNNKKADLSPHYFI